MDVREKLIDILRKPIFPRKADRSNTIAAFCLFACAVVVFCTVVCKITTPKLKPQEGALKCEIEAQ